MIDSHLVVPSLLVWSYHLEGGSRPSPKHVQNSSQLLFWVYSLRNYKDEVLYLQFTENSHIKYIPRSPHWSKYPFFLLSAIVTLPFRIEQSLYFQHLQSGIFAFPQNTGFKFNWILFVHFVIQYIKTPLPQGFVNSAGVCDCTSQQSPQLPAPTPAPANHSPPQLSFASG